MIIDFVTDNYVVITIWSNSLLRRKFRNTWAKNQHLSSLVR